MTLTQKPVKYRKNRTEDWSCVSYYLIVSRSGFTGVNFTSAFQRAVLLKKEK